MAARSSFRPGFDEGSVDNIGERLSWDETPLRCLHLCFLRAFDAPIRTIPSAPADPDGERHARSHDARRPQAAPATPSAAGRSAWKQEKYMRGDLVTVDGVAVFQLRANSWLGCEPVRAVRANREVALCERCKRGR